MAGMFYAAARNDMKSRMLERKDESFQTQFISEWVTETAPVAADVDGPKTRGSFLARLRGFAPRPAARLKETGRATN